MNHEGPGFPRAETLPSSPDLRVANGTAQFARAKKLSNVNPRQGEYLWDHRQLVDFKDKDGHRLQAPLAPG